MKKLSTIFLLIICPTLLISCLFAEEIGPGEPFITFYNNSDKTVCLLYTHNYPDTTITKEDNPNFDSEGIPPHTHRLAYSYLSRKQVFRRNYIVQIYVLDWDKTRSKLPFEERFSYLRRYELTRKWLEEHDWTVTYP